MLAASQPENHGIKCQAVYEQGCEQGGAGEEKRNGHILRITETSCQEAPMLGVGQAAACAQVLGRCKQQAGRRRVLLVGKGGQGLWVSSVLHPAAS